LGGLCGVGALCILVTPWLLDIAGFNLEIGPMRRIRFYMFF
jgi:hypothetical protein